MATERTLTQPEIDANVAKTLAEAELALASAGERVAAARLAEVEASARASEEAHTKLLIKHSGIENKIAEIALAKCDREEAFARVSDIYHKVYTFQEVVAERSVKQCIQTLTAWSRQDPGCDIDLIINSPGGDIIEGFALIDFLLELRHKGHKITTTALGMAASMGAVLLQAGTTRVMGPNSILLIHEGSLGAIGSYAEVEDRISLMKLFHTRIVKLFEDRAKPINSHTTETFIRKNWARKDWWLDAETSLKLGFCDSIR